MSFWLVVLAALIGVPAALLFTGMGMIFWVGGLAGGPQESRAPKIVAGWLAIAWVLASAFGAFGVVPLWHAWHAGETNFDGAQRTFVDWLLVLGGVGAAIAALRAIGARKQAGDRRSPLAGVLRWLLPVLGFVPWAAFAAWIAWPLAEWPARGRFEWPDAATAWTHAGEITALLLAAMLVETAIRRIRKR